LRCACSVVRSPGCDDLHPRLGQAADKIPLIPYVEVVQPPTLAEALMVFLVVAAFTYSVGMVIVLTLRLVRD